MLQFTRTVRANAYETLAEVWFTNALKSVNMKHAAHLMNALD